MTPFMRSRGLTWAMICASVLVASALAATAPALAQQREAAAGGAGTSDATRNLFDAVQANDLAAVQASITAGADLLARDQWGLTPIDLAIDKSYFEIAHFLLSVRNFQQNAAAPRSLSVTRQPATGSRAAAPTATTDRARRSQTESSRPAPAMAGSQASSAQADHRPPVERWPANQANPFDPARPAPGAVLPADGAEKAFRGTGHTAAAERPQVQ